MSTFGCLLEVQFPPRTLARILWSLNTGIPEQGSTFLSSDTEWCFWKSRGHHTCLLHFHVLSHISASRPALHCLQWLYRDSLCPSKLTSFSWYRDEIHLQGKSQGLLWKMGNQHQEQVIIVKGSIMPFRKKKTTKQISKAKTWKHCVCMALGCEANKFLFQGWEPSGARGKDAADS